MHHYLRCVLDFQRKDRDMEDMTKEAPTASRTWSSDVQSQGHFPGADVTQDDPERLPLLLLLSGCVHCICPLPVLVLCMGGLGECGGTSGGDQRPWVPVSVSTGGSALGPIMSRWGLSSALDQSGERLAGGCLGWDVRSMSPKGHSAPGDHGAGLQPRVSAGPQVSSFLCHRLGPAFPCGHTAEVSPMRCDT